MNGLALNEENTSVFDGIFNTIRAVTSQSLHSLN
jgi:hypothetical protein